MGGSVGLAVVIAGVVSHSVNRTHTSPAWTVPGQQVSFLPLHCVINVLMDVGGLDLAYLPSAQATSLVALNVLESSQLSVITHG